MQDPERRTTAIDVLHSGEERLQFFPMKFALAILVYLIMAAIIGAGVLLLVLGKPLLFIIAIIVYVVAFGRLGCMTH